MSIFVSRDRFGNTLNKFRVVAVLGFGKVFTTTDIEALASGVFGWEHKSGRSEVNMKGRDLVSPTLRVCCSEGCTNW